jgi:hypothetical protein
MFALFHSLCVLPTYDSSAANKSLNVTCRFSTIKSLICAAFTTVLDVLGRIDAIIITDVLSKIFEFFTPFSDMLHSRYDVVVHLYQMAVKFDRENIFHPSKPNETLRGIEFSKSLPLRHKLPFSCT